MIGSWHVIRGIIIVAVVVVVTMMVLGIEIWHMGRKHNDK